MGKPFGATSCKLPCQGGGQLISSSTLDADLGGRVQAQASSVAGWMTSGTFGLTLWSGSLHTLRASLTPSDKLTRANTVHVCGSCEAGVCQVPVVLPKPHSWGSLLGPGPGPEAGPAASSLTAGRGNVGHCGGSWLLQDVGLCEVLSVHLRPSFPSSRRFSRLAPKHRRLSRSCT